MRIYLDLVMGLNFLVDFLLLRGADQLCGKAGGTSRCAAAAALGAVYGGLCLVPGLGFLAGLPCRMIILMGMGWLAYGAGKDGYRRLLVFLLLTFALGGIALGLDVSGGVAAILCAAGIWALCVLGRTQEKREYVPVEVTWKEKRISVVALMDTGNGLKDPVTGESVLVLGPEEAWKLLGLEESALRNPAQTLVTRPELKLRLIPYRAVSCGGMLVGKRFDQVKLGRKQCSALVAFAPERIGCGNGFQALAGGMTG